MNHFSSQRLSKKYLMASNSVDICLFTLDPTWMLFYVQKRFLLLTLVIYKVILTLHHDFIVSHFIHNVMFSCATNNVGHFLVLAWVLVSVGWLVSLLLSMLHEVYVKKVTLAFAARALPQMPTMAEAQLFWKVAHAFSCLHGLTWILNHI